MNFKKWLEDAGPTHDDYVNAGPYSGIRSKYRAKDNVAADDKQALTHKVMTKKLRRFGTIDSKLL